MASAANPGFGGGGLFSLTGRMLGVVSLNLNEVARNSLSIPIDCYRTHEAEMLRHGRPVSRPRRAWLGVFAHALEEGPSRAVISVADVDEGQDVRGVEKKPVLAQELDRWPRFGVP